MDTSSPRPGLHPMLWVAAASVTAVSLAGVARLTGLLPASSPEPAPVVAVQPAPADTPVAPPAAPKVADAPVAEPPARVDHAPAPRHETPKPKAVAKTTPAPAATAQGAEPVVPAGRPVADVPPPPPVCRDCGVIESNETHQVKGEGSGLGAVGGALLGGILGNQVGEGSGKKLARIGGAVLGGFAGNEVERRERSTVRYDVTVRLDDGTRRVLTQSQAPAWREGDRVRLHNGEILPYAPPASGAPRSSF